MTPSTPHALVLICLAGSLGGCGSSPAGQCEINADCASGVCGDDGQCNTNDAPDAGPDSDGGPDAGGLSACGGVIDEEITRDEVPMKAGIQADFRVAADLSFDTSGELVEGVRHWDLAQDFNGDADVAVELFDTQSAWYNTLFPDASYSAKLATGSDLLGVFQLTDSALLLLGVVSPEDGFTRTELTYDPPVTLMPIPLVEGASFSTDSTVSGLAQGIASFYSEEYVGLADSSGILSTPFGEFRVIRNRIEMTRTVGLLVTETKQYNFVSECTGIVGSMLSKEGEQDVDFSEVAEIRRLIP